MTITDARDVFSLFVIPVGGGIPAGVIMAQSRGIWWPVTALIYFVSDVCLACVFEPLMLLFLRVSKRFAFTQNLVTAFRAHQARVASRFAVAPGPITLIMISFGVDPMTGRAVAKSVGHGFVSGWFLAICGDMIFFAILFVSTVWLNSWLGDGTWAAVIITILMFTVPPLIRRWRRKPEDAAITVS